MHITLRLGVIGLGPRWRRRYLPALQALREDFLVAAVCDPAARRAQAEAKRLGCAQAAGPGALLERPDVDALLLADLSWHRLWPAELACRLGKPVLCGPSLEEDDAHADTLVGLARAGRQVVMPDLTLREAVAARLGALPQGYLDDVRLVRLDVTAPAPGKPRRWLPDNPVSRLLRGRGVALLDVCLGLLGEAPARVGAVETPLLTTLVLETPGGRVAQVNQRRAGAGRRVARLELTGPRGTATLTLPGALTWAESGGTATRTFAPGRPPVQELLLRFARAVQDRQTPRPSLDDLGPALGALRAAARNP